MKSTKECPRVKDIVDECVVIDGKRTLNSISRDVSSGGYIVVKEAGKYFLFSPEEALCMPGTRLVIDVPLKEVITLSPDLSCMDAMKYLHRDAVDSAVVEERGRILGVLTHKAVIENLYRYAKQVADTGVILNHILDRTGVIIFRVSCEKIYEIEDLTPDVFNVELYGDAKRILGYDSTELCSNKELLLRIIEPDDREKIVRIFKGINFHRSRLLSFNIRVLARSGRPLWFRMNVVTETRKNGDGLKLLGVLLDITKELFQKEKEKYVNTLASIAVRYEPAIAIRKVLSYISRFIPVNVGLLCVVERPFNMKMDILWAKSGWRKRAERLEKSLREKITSIVNDVKSVREVYVDNPIIEAIRTGKIIYKPDITKSNFVPSRVVLKYDINSGFIVPLMSEDQRSMVLALASEEKELDFASYKKFLESARPVLMYLVARYMYFKKMEELNQNLAKLVQRKSYHINILYEITDKISHTVSFDSLFEAIESSLEGIVEHHVFISLLKIGDSVKVAVYPRKPIKKSLLEELTGKVVDTFRFLGGVADGKIVKVYHPRFKVKGKAKIEKLKSCFYVPIEVLDKSGKKKIQGLIFIASSKKDAFSDEHVEVLREITDQAARSISKLKGLLEKERKKAELLIEDIDTGLILVTEERKITMVNSSGEEYVELLFKFGKDGRIEKIYNFDAEDLFTDDEESLYREIELSTPRRRILALRVLRVREKLENERWIVKIDDLTEQRLISEKVELQSRLAAVGQLTAGIAHDFNNILTPIIGWAQILGLRKDLPEDVIRTIEMIKNQGDRAANLIKQILDFSRRSISERRKINIAPLVKEIVKLLERTIPEDIKIELRCISGDLVAEIDVTAFQQVITNIAVNARDAMPGGGKFIIELDKAVFSKDSEKPFKDMRDGEWIVLRFRDTGEGIAPSVLPHVFEPFFTTKGRDRGTGLGLSQVYGIVKQHGGYIDVESEVGVGTLFTIYLPAASSEGSLDIIPETVRKVEKGKGEFIMIVEDEDSVRQSLKEMLINLGYRVIEAVDGKDGLNKYKQNKGKIKLVLTDWVMPGMSGADFIKRLRKIDAEVKIGVLTGYPIGKNLGTDQNLGVDRWMKKPVDIKELSKILRDLLGKGGVLS